MRLAIISMCGLVVTLCGSVLTATEKPKESTTSIMVVEKSLATPVTPAVPKKLRDAGAAPIVLSEPVPLPLSSSARGLRGRVAATNGIPEPTPAPLSGKVASDSGTLVPQKEPQTETVPCPDCCPSHGAGSLCGGRPCWGERIHRFKALMQASHWGYPEYFVARPLGSLLQAHMRTQACNALADQMVLYRYDFFDGVFEDASKLNPQGCKQLDRLIVMFQCGMHPLVIERAADDSQLDAARRSQVLKLLKEAEFPVPPEYVVVGDPETARLSGEEAVEIHRNLLQQTRSKGGAVGGTTGGAAGFFVQPIPGSGSQR